MCEDARQEHRPAAQGRVLTAAPTWLRGAFIKSLITERGTAKDTVNKLFVFFCPQKPTKK